MGIEEDVLKAFMEQFNPEKYDPAQRLTLNLTTIVETAVGNSRAKGVRKTLFKKGNTYPIEGLGVSSATIAKENTALSACWGQRDAGCTWVDGSNGQYGTITIPAKKGYGAIATGLENMAKAKWIPNSCFFYAGSGKKLKALSEEIYRTSAKKEVELQQSSGDRERKIDELVTEIENLQKRLNQGGQDASAIEALNKEVERLRQELQNSTGNNKELETKVAKAKQKLRAKKEELAAAQQKNQELEGRVLGIQNNFERIQSEYQELQRTRDADSNELNKLREQLGKEEEKLSKLTREKGQSAEQQNEIARLNAEIQIQQAALDKQQRAAARIEQDAKAREEEFNRIQAESAAEIESLRKKNEQLAASAEKAKEKKRKLKKDKAEFEAKMQNWQEQTAIYQEQQANADKQIAALQEQLQAEIDSRNLSGDNKNSLIEDLKKSKEELAAYRKDLEELRELTDKLQTAREKEITKLNENYKKLKEKKKALKTQVKELTSKLQAASSNPQAASSKLDMEGQIRKIEQEFNDLQKDSAEYKAEREKVKEKIAAIKAKAEFKEQKGKNLSAIINGLAQKCGIKDEELSNLIMEEWKNLPDLPPMPAPPPPPPPPVSVKDTPARSGTVPKAAKSQIPQGGQLAAAADASAISAARQRLQKVGEGDHPAQEKNAQEKDPNALTMQEIFERAWSIRQGVEMTDSYEPSDDEYTHVDGKLVRKPGVDDGW